MVRNTFLAAVTTLSLMGLSSAAFAEKNCMGTPTTTTLNEKTDKPPFVINGVQFCTFNATVDFTKPACSQKMQVNYPCDSEVEGGIGMPPPADGIEALGGRDGILACVADDGTGAGDGTGDGEPLPGLDPWYSPEVDADLQELHVELYSTFAVSLDLLPSDEATALQDAVMASYLLGLDEIAAYLAGGVCVAP